MNVSNSSHDAPQAYIDALKNRGCSAQLAQEAGEILSRHQDNPNYSPLERAILQRVYHCILNIK